LPSVLPCVLINYPLLNRFSRRSPYSLEVCLRPYLSTRRHSPLATRHFLFYPSSMFSRLRQLETDAELYDVAVRALMRRAHSIHEMKQKLERRSDNKLLVQVVMARLKESGMIDDAL